MWPNGDKEPKDTGDGGKPPDKEPPPPSYFGDVVQEGAKPPSIRKEERSDSKPTE